MTVEDHRSRLADALERLERVYPDGTDTELDLGPIYRADITPENPLRTG
jgi:hypothetical protein